MLLTFLTKAGRGPHVARRVHEGVHGLASRVNSNKVVVLPRECIYIYIYIYICMVGMEKAHERVHVEH